jgi:NDP-sugar pyrophosphorylase family protein
MNLVITMAGRSERFRQAGFNIPKWRISVNDKLMLYYALKPFLQFNGLVVFVSLKSEEAKSEIETICSDLQISHYLIREVEEILMGQAASVEAAIDLLPQGQPFAVWNIDTIFLGQFEKVMPKGGFWLTLTNLEGDMWSFAKISNFRVVEVAEKIPISRDSSIGLYGFPNPESFLEAYKVVYSEKYVERYVAPLYNYWIKHGYVVLPNFVHPQQIIPIGTPQQLFKAWQVGLITLDNKSLDLLKYYFDK